MKIDSEKKRILRTPKGNINKSFNYNFESPFGYSNRLVTVGNDSNTKNNYRKFSKINKSEIDLDSLNLDNISEDFSQIRKK